jgi:hypothetical protein
MTIQFPLDSDTFIQCVADAEKQQYKPEFCQHRYVSFFYGVEGLTPLRQADSLYEAIDNFSDFLAQDQYYGKQTGEPNWLSEAWGEVLSNITSFKRRLLIYWSLGEVISNMNDMDHDNYNSQEACIDRSYVSETVSCTPNHVIRQETVAFTYAYPSQ